MRQIFSKVEEGKLLHRITRKDDVTPGRTDLASEKEFLQCAALNLPKGKTFRPHKHLYKDGEDKAIAQESWVIIKGKAKFVMYDLDDQVIAEETLNEGDMSMTFYGGHTYEVLEEGTIVYEFKTGPYYGQKIDKVFLD